MDFYFLGGLCHGENHSVCNSPLDFHLSYCSSYWGLLFGQKDPRLNLPCSNMMGEDNSLHSGGEEFQFAQWFIIAKDMAGRLA